MNYTSLKTRVVQETENDSTEFSDAFNDMVNAAEERIARDLDTYGYVRHEYVSITNADPFLTKPPLTILVKSLHILTGSTRTQLPLKTNEFLLEYWPDRTSVGYPKYWAHWSQEHLIFAPTPDNSYYVEMEYVTYPTILSASHSVNWFTTYASRLLQLAVFVEAYRWMKHWEAMGIMEALYVKELARMRDEDRRSRQDDSAPADAAGDNTARY